MTETAPSQPHTTTAQSSHICADRARHSLYTALGLELDLSPVAGPKLRALHRLRMLGRGPLRLASRTTGRGYGDTPFTLDHVAGFSPRRFGTSIGFDGLVVTRPHGLRLQGRILITGQRTGLSNTFTHKLLPDTRDGMKRVGFGLPEFDERYAVYADDQTEARLVLPPDFMERLLRFQDAELRAPSSILFDHRHMQTVLPTPRSMRVSDRPRFASAKQAHRVLSRDLTRIFTLFAKVDVLHAKADRHCPEATERARREHFVQRIACIPNAALPLTPTRPAPVEDANVVDAPVEYWHETKPSQDHPGKAHLAPTPVRMRAL